MRGFTGLRERAITALFYGPISLLAIFLGPVSTLALLAFFGYYSGRELEALFRKDIRSRPVSGYGLLSFVCFLIPGILFLTDVKVAIALPLVWVGFMYAVWLAFRFMRKLQVFHPGYLISTCVGYISIPLSLFYWIGLQEGAFNYKWLVMLLSHIWANDTVAYFTGTRWGRRPLALRISPNKTWEGTIGGWLACIGIACIWAQYWGALNFTQWVILGAITGPACTLGDLIESKVKRDLDIKDSGRSFPGHGGFLDRLDSLLFSTPIVAFYLWMV